MGRRPPALLALLGLMAVSACGAPSAEELVPPLGEPRTTEDTLPVVEGERVPEEVVADSARHLGSTTAAEYWVVLDDAGRICVVQALGGDVEAVSSSCATPERFADAGVWVGGATEEESARGLVVPDGFDLADAPPDEDWSMVGDNLAAPADEVA